MCTTKNNLDSSLIHGFHKSVKKKQKKLLKAYITELL